MNLIEMLKDLLAQQNPTAQALRERYAPQAKSIMIAGENLDRPSWADGVHGKENAFLEMGGDVVGVSLYDDGRGWGTYAELAVSKGTLAELESVVGTMNGMPPFPGDFTSGPRFAAYVGKIRVFAERAHKSEDVVRVTVHFQK